MFQGRVRNSVRQQGMLGCVKPERLWAPWGTAATQPIIAMGECGFSGHLMLQEKLEIQILMWNPQGLPKHICGIDLTYTLSICDLWVEAEISHI